MALADPWDYSEFEPDTGDCFATGEGGGRPINARLRRFGSKGKKHVLLVHGASAGSRTFMVPNGGLLQYLLDDDWDVWTLDWRSSNLFRGFNQGNIPPNAPSIGLSEYAQQFDLDRSVHEDLAGALVRIRKEIGECSISIVAHCIGGAIVAMAMGARVLEDIEGVSVPHVVLTTLGLFYRVGMDGWLKGNDHPLEGILEEIDTFSNSQHPTISPWVASEDFQGPWPPAFEKLYKMWKSSPMPHGCGAEFCNRSSFMFGLPYRATDMMQLHDMPNGERQRGLWAQFGDMPLKIYMHCVRNLRCGYATPFSPSGTEDLKRYIKPEAFVGDNGRPARTITLITGDENQVWHRDSIDRMYEWLLNHAAPEHRGWFQKHVLPDYGHQDLYWSTKAKDGVYPYIAAGLEDSPSRREEEPG